MKNWTIRPFTPADQTAVFKLVNAGLGQRFEKTDPSYNPDLVDIYQSYIAQGDWFVVVDGPQGIIGCGALVHENGRSDVARIVRVSVRADQQGQGLGRLISQHLINLAREQQFQQILVETNSDWYDALHLYQSCGFTEYERTVSEAFGFTEVHMVLNLTEDK